MSFATLLAIFQEHHTLSHCRELNPCVRRDERTLKKHALFDINIYMPIVLSVRSLRRRPGFYCPRGYNV